jgi:hypothetical protein
MLCLWLFTLALAAWPELHELFHTDAKSPEHHCAVSDVLHGKLCFDGPVAVAVEAVPQVAVEPVSFVSLVLPAVPCRLAPGRAPPAVSSSLI